MEQVHSRILEIDLLSISLVGYWFNSVVNLLIVVLWRHVATQIWIKYAHFCSDWSIVGYETGAFWDLWNWSIANIARALLIQLSV